MDGLTIGDCFEDGDGSSDRYDHIPGRGETSRTPTRHRSSTSNDPTTPTLFSIEENLDEYPRHMQKFMKQYHSLKICFFILLILNSILVVLYILTDGTFSLKNSTEHDQLYNRLVAYMDNKLPTDRKKTFYLCTTYDNLSNKLNLGNIMSNKAITAILNNICKSERHPDYCCFKSTDDFFSLFNEFTENYVQYRMKIAKQNCFTNLSNTELYHLSSIKPSHKDCRHSNTGSRNWTVPFTGYYFLYCNSINPTTYLKTSSTRHPCNDFKRIFNFTNGTVIRILNELPHNDFDFDFGIYML